MQIQLMMVHLNDEYECDQYPMLMMMRYHYMDKKEVMKKIQHQLSMDYDQRILEYSKQMIIDSILNSSFSI